MKRLAVILLVVFGLLSAFARAEIEVSFDFFYDELAPMGEWAEVDGYGYVWHPNDVDGEWAPYTDGYWSYTDAGWTWVSYEDWGGITYHYGRWVFIDELGWCWVPAYEWGPAWVSWRHSDDYVGWAPLPPECAWEPDRGFGVWVDVHYDIGPRWYSFCHVRDFGAPVLRHVLLPRHRNVSFCFETRNITNISFNRDFGCVFNGGFDYDWIARRCERPLPALKLVFNTTNIYVQGNRRNVFVNAPRGNALIVAAPRRAERDFARPTRVKPVVSRKFERAAVRRGWAGLENEPKRESLIAKMREETKGLRPENAPARPVRAEALAHIPKKVDLEARPAALRKLPAERRGGENGASQGETAERGKATGGRPGRQERTAGVDNPGNQGPAPGIPNGQPANVPGARGKVTGDDARPGGGGLRRRPVAGVPDASQKVEESNPAPSAGAPAGPGRRAARGAAVERAEEVARERQERAAEMQQENARRNAAAQAAQEKAARENARQNAVQERAAEAAARRAQMEQAEQARRRAAQNEATERAAEGARRQAAERQNDLRRMQVERQAEAQAARQRASAQQAERAAAAERQQRAAQQGEARQRAAQAAQERAAAQAQRQQAAEMQRARAMENQQRAAAAAQARAQAQVQAQARAQAQAAQAAQAQQRAAAQSARRQYQPQQRAVPSGRGRGKRGEE